MICPRCAGARSIHDTAYTLIACTLCEGAGQVDRNHPHFDRPTPKVVLVVCPDCGGDGTKPYLSKIGIESTMPCPTCKGEREVHPAVALDFKT